MLYNKLVRDKIPDVIKANGDEAIFHVAGDEEYYEKLKEKVLEEFNEFVEDESPEEFVDLMEVLDAIAEYIGFDKAQLEAIRRAKNEKRGAFKGRIILDES